MAETPLSVGIVGYGYAAKTFHIPLIRACEEYKLSAICSSSLDKVPQQLGTAALFRSPDELFASNAIEVVVITAPNTEHFSLAKRALECGKHVILEKPFVVTSLEGEQLCEIAERSKRLLNVFHNRRWDNGFLTAKKLIETGRLGKIALYEARYDRFRPSVQDLRWREKPQPGSGILFDLGSHLLDQAVQLFGLPDALSADITAQRLHALVDDFFVVTLMYGSQRVIVRASNVIAGSYPHIAIYGERGSYLKCALDPQEGHLKQNPDRWVLSMGKAVESERGVLTVPEEDRSVIAEWQEESGNYREFYRLFAKALRMNLPGPVPAFEALNVIRLIELAIESNNQRKVVDLSFLKNR